MGDAAGGESGEIELKKFAASNQFKMNPQLSEIYMQQRERKQGSKAYEAQGFVIFLYK